MIYAPDPVEQTALDDLKRRLQSTGRARLPEGIGWERGVDVDYLAELVSYWANSYDWRIAERRIQSLPWTGVAVDGTTHRALHQAVSGGATTVVLLHGWPDSFLRFARVLPLLTEVNVVVPCLPGFPYGFAPTRPGMSTAAMAELVAGVMADLGYDRYVVSGGDVGSSVAEALAHAHPDRVSALHLTDVPYTHIFTVDADDLSEEEQSYLQAGQQWQFAEGAYALEQSTKPHTLAVGLGDSPAGLAAGSWRSCAAGATAAATSSRCGAAEELLDWVTLYWATERSAPRSPRTSNGPNRSPAGSRCRRTCRSSRTISCPRRAPSRNGSSISGSGPGTPTAATSPPGSVRNDFLSGLRAAVALAT